VQKMIVRKDELVFENFVWILCELFVLKKFGFIKKHRPEFYIPFTLIIIFPSFFFG